MYMIRPIDLSCDVYHGATSIVHKYRNFKPRIIEKTYFKNESGPVSFAVVDKRNLYITFRGCNNLDEVVKCIETKVVKPFPNKDVFINSAILNGFEEIKEDVDKLIEDYTEEYDIDNIVFSGHSLGGSIAQVASTYCVTKNKNKIFTFGSPHVGNKGFCEEVANKSQYHIRYVAKYDVIPEIKFNKLLRHNGRKVELPSPKKLFFPYNLYQYHTCMNYNRSLNGKKLILHNQDDEFIK